MKVLDDGSVYLEKGELVPYRCDCGNYIQTKEPVVHCDKCGLDHDAAELADRMVFRRENPN